MRAKICTAISQNAIPVLSTGFFQGMAKFVKI